MYKHYSQIQHTTSSQVVSIISNILFPISYTAHTLDIGLVGTAECKKQGMTCQEVHANKQGMM